MQDGSFHSWIHMWVAGVTLIPEWFNSDYCTHCKVLYKCPIYVINTCSWPTGRHGGCRSLRPVENRSWQYLRRFENRCRATRQPPCLSSLTLTCTKYAFSSQTHKMFKLSYHQNYCMDSNQILHTSKEHQIWSVGGPKTWKTNPRWQMAAILKNCDISSTAWLISMKFEKLMHLGPLQLVGY